MHAQHTHAVCVLGKGRLWSGGAGNVGRWLPITKCDGQPATNCSVPIWALTGRLQKKSHCGRF